MPSDRKPASNAASRRFVQTTTPVTARSGDVLGVGWAVFIDEDDLDDPCPTPRSEPFRVHSLFDYVIDEGDRVEVRRVDSIMIVEDVLG